MRPAFCDLSVSRANHWRVSYITQVGGRVKNLHSLVTDLRQTPPSPHTKSSGRTSTANIPGKSQHPTASKNGNRCWARRRPETQGAGYETLESTRSGP